MTYLTNARRMTVIGQRSLCKLLLAIFVILVFSSSPVNSKTNSKVVDLTVSSFDEQTREGLWLLEFYAPWCGHCKKLAPLWDELSTSQSTAKLGKIDIPANEALASKHNITKFPTIKYAKDGRIGKYVGARTREGFLAFLTRMSEPPVTEVEDLQTLDQLYSASSPVIFVLTIGKEAEGINVRVTDAFITVASKLQAEATFAILRLKSMSSTAYTVSKMQPDHHARHMQKMEPGDEDYEGAIERFVDHNRMPLVSQLDSHNFKQLGELGKSMVIAVVKDSDKLSSEEFVEALSHSAGALSIEDADRFVFGVLDGVKWKTFVSQYGVKAPSMLILDFQKNQHYNMRLPITGEAPKDTIATLIKNLMEGSVPMETSEETDIFLKAMKKFRLYFPYSLLAIVLPVLLILISILIPFPGEKKIKEA